MSYLNSLLLSLLVIGFIFCGCAGEKVSEEGDLISFHYTGKLEDGTVFDSSLEREPLAVNLGGGEIIPGLEKELYGLKIGDKKEIRVSPEEGYGMPRPDLIANIPREFIPNADQLEIGQVIQNQAPSGQIMSATILEIGADSIKIDANPPLAGKVMIFEIEVTDISKPAN